MEGLHMTRPSKRVSQFSLQIILAMLLLLCGILFYVHSNATANSLLVSHANKVDIIKTNQSNTPTIGSFKFGMYIDNPYVFKDEKKIDYKLNLVGWFVHWNENMESNKLKNTCAAGYVPAITWESWVAKNGVAGSKDILSEINKGKYDQKIINDINSIKKNCPNQTVLIRFDHEMDSEPGTKLEDKYYPWQGNPKQYIEAWRRIVKIGHSKNSNIKWIWSPNRGNDFAKQYYPGDQFVDYVGITLNNRRLNGGGYSNFKSFYEPNQEVLESYNKPIIITETSDTGTAIASDKADWVNGMFDYINSNPKITAIVWFNNIKILRYDTSNESVQAFKDNLNKLEQLNR